MKKIIVLLLALPALHLAFSQQASPTVVASAGGYMQNANGSLSYTIGEMSMVQTFSNNNSILTQGFQQPDELLSSLIAQTANAGSAFMLYPNPAIDNMWFGFQFDEPGYVSISMTNDVGQQIGLVYQANYQSGQLLQQLDVSKLSAGAYFLSLSFNSKKEGKTSIQSKKFIVIK